MGGIRDGESGLSVMGPPRHPSLVWALCRDGLGASVAALEFG